MGRKATATCTLPVEGIEVTYREPTVGILKKIQKTIPILATSLELEEGKSQKLSPSEFGWEQSLLMIKHLSISPEFVIFEDDVLDEGRILKEGQYDLDDLHLNDFTFLIKHMTNTLGKFTQEAKEESDPT